uniref:uncharacterized protein LOC124054744 isoform X2 n=1 Tax=Scatophagus argus TaxID=75038 RepID=UPI001ED85459|nr:uncharacterized protein LOC124054744 isoform X2 [Scatophagus argus]
MEVVAVCLLLLLNSPDSGSAGGTTQVSKRSVKLVLLCGGFMVQFLISSPPPVSVTVAPETSQFFKYDSFSVSCEEDEEDEGRREEDGPAGWRVMRRTRDGEVHPCPLSCSISAAFPATDSGVYWCQTELGETSGGVNITVSAGSVILDGPVLPVTEGDDVTLSCRRRVRTSACVLTADFFKDGVLIETSSTGNLTLRTVSRFDEGLYRCKVCGFPDSPESWLTVTAPPADQDLHVPVLSVATLLRHLVVGTPYLLSTVLLGLIYRDRSRAQRTYRPRQTCNRVVMETAA